MDIREIHRRELAEALKRQKQAHDEYVGAIEARLSDLEQKAEDYGVESMAIYIVLKKHPDVLAEFVAELYSGTTRERAKRIVADFHDEALDLSTLECTGNDFKPWK